LVQQSLRSFFSSFFSDHPLDDLQGNGHLYWPVSPALLYTETSISNAPFFFFSPSTFRSAFSSCSRFSTVPYSLQYPLTCHRYKWRYFKNGIRPPRVPRDVPTYSQTKIFVFVSSNSSLYLEKFPPYPPWRSLIVQPLLPPRNSCTPFPCHKKKDLLDLMRLSVAHPRVTLPPAALWPDAPTVGE